MSVWSPFANAVTKTIPFPGSEVDTVTIKKLSWRSLEAAEAENQRKGIALAKEIGPGGLLAELNGQGGEQAVRDKVASNPMLKYDRSTLLEKGIVGWTISQKPTPEEIAELDEDTAKWLATEIYELSRPKSGAEAKNA